MKSLTSLLYITALLTSGSALADAYKCMQGGRPMYQATPCELNSDKGKLDIKLETPEEKAAAQEKLDAIRAEYEAEKTAEEEAQKSAKSQRGQQTQQPAQTPAPRTMYTYGNPLNNPADANSPQNADQPVKIIYPWGNPRYQPTE